MSFLWDLFKNNLQTQLFSSSSRHQIYGFGIDQKQNGYSNVNRSGSPQSGETIQVPKGVHTLNNSIGVPGDYTTSLLPLPDWNTAIEKWGVCWHLHVYGFAAVFILLTLASCGVFLRFRWRVQKFKIVFNTLLLLAISGVLRAIFMLVDPYGYKGLMATLMTGILMQAVYPLFCAGYGLTQVMLLRLTKVDVGNSKVRSLSWLMGCTLTYLFLVVIIESLVSFERSLKILLLLDSGCFIAWSLYLGITFICSGFRLSQYANEAKRARKELNAFSTNRRSTTSNTSIIATSLTTNFEDARLDDADIISVNESYSQNAATDGADRNSTTPQPTQAMKNSVRLSRPKLKFSDKNHMMVTIASDEDDVSTSSTDVENYKADVSHPRCVRKRYRHKGRSSTSKATSSNGTYIAVATSGEFRSSENTPGIKSTSLATELTNIPQVLENSTHVLALSTVESIDSYSILLKEIVSQYPICNFKNDIANKTQSCVENVHHQELPLLKAPGSSFMGSLNIINEVSKPESTDSCDDDFSEDVDSEIRQRKNFKPKKASSIADKNKNTSIHDTSSLLGIEFLSDLCNDNMGDRAYSPADLKLNNHTYPAVSQAEHSIYTHPENGHPNNSPKDNGYMADTENVFYCPSVSKTLACNDESGQVSFDLSQRSTPTHSDEDSVMSPALSDKMMSLTPAALGLFRIRQSKMVQRAVHLTYFLTFLFLFACLLQLYTVFGVYGVLGTIPRPDPWPWLIFHTIFRASEVSIGFTTLFIAFDTLNQRHQRTKRRKQQQQHQQHQQNLFGERTRDCIV